MNLLDAIRFNRPFRRSGWTIWIYLTPGGGWVSAHQDRIKEAAHDPNYWPREPYTLMRGDYLATDWEILP